MRRRGGGGEEEEEEKWEEEEGEEVTLVKIGPKFEAFSVMITLETPREIYSFYVYACVCVCVWVLGGGNVVVTQDYFIQVCIKFC